MFDTITISTCQKVIDSTFINIYAQLSQKCVKIATKMEEIMLVCFSDQHFSIAVIPGTVFKVSLFIFFSNIVNFNQTWFNHSCIQAFNLFFYNSLL